MTRVLHIDTDPQFATLVKRVLKTADNDLDVTSVSDQDKVWPALHRDVEYDCIVSGYQMGTIDGIELVRSLRGEGVDTPFIIYTWYGSEIEKSALQAGVTEYIQKEMGVATCAKLADEILEHAHPVAQA